MQTSYLIAEVIAIPVVRASCRAREFGTRLLFVISAGGFTAASFLCGFASSIEQMILWRAIQGFLGAGMIPTVFASAYTVFPRTKFHIVGPIIGLVATLAPTIGPTVGGYITDALSWHWLFFINVIPGLGIIVGVWTLVDFDQPDFELLDHFDWFGLIAMAGFLVFARSNTCWRRGRNMNGCRITRSRFAPRSAPFPPLHSSTAC